MTLGLKIRCWRNDLECVLGSLMVHLSQCWSHAGLAGKSEQLSMSNLINQFVKVKLSGISIS